ncbi:VOC family protein [Actinoplanes sp. CA-131856]
MSEVIGLGYVLVEASDLGAWKSFAVDLLGLQAVTDTEERLTLRMDEKSYRLDIRRGPADAVTTLGWEVRGKRELEELARKLEANGYSVKRESGEAAAERHVSELIQFDDPEGLRLELYYGQRNALERFVSPTGAQFVTGTGGLGHAFQFVGDMTAYDRLYLDILGFKVSDYIDFGPGMFGTFTHANPRHHSLAYAAVPDLPSTIGHLMFEVDDIDLVGRAYDNVLDGAAPIASTFGKHVNDEMLSFYVTTPSGFQIEYGYGGLLIDDATWTPARYEKPSYWGHRPTNPDEPRV